MTILFIVLAAAQVPQSAADVPFMERVAAKGIGAVLSRVMDAPCSVSRVKLDPDKQVLEVGGLEIGNPKGFNSPEAISVGQALVEADPKLLFGSAPEIRVISISGVVVNAEANTHGVNLKKLLDNANRRIPSSLSSSGDPNKRFKVHKAVLDGADVNLITMLPAAKTSQMKLDRIETSLMGPDNRGVTASEAMSAIMELLIEKTGIMEKGIGSILDPLGSLFNR